MNILKGVLAATVISLSAFTSDGQIIVRVRPPRPAVVTVRPTRPSPRHVWIDEDWVGEGDHYRWNGGHWVVPPRPRAVWVPGSWRHSRRGDVWVPGRWR
jgi:hypothetical protein